ncbi:MAG: T9SS type A sorting domain-containing protein [Saprospiraceae bacterium]|jgi:hypothetical protein|nr:T9SS type A sorting domain-containing protein [Saprospiraceae bacterium]MBL0023551.1 T9SS type A sorting domain-containing protein [Saprospiraceae bacterium]
MKVFLSFVISSFMYCAGTNAQDFVSAQLLGSSTKQEITATYALPLILFGAKYYKIRYTSPDAKGKKDTLSGLIVVPDNLNYKFPRAVYQHGTSDCKTCVPSRYGTAGGEEGQVGLLIAGLGFVAILPDYVGMGDGRGFQTYVHESTIASAGRNMVTACEKWAKDSGVFFNDQLFITGYSQGGYGSMALHKSYEENPSALSVTAAAHLSGPYSLSGVMRDLILGDNEYGFPGYVPNTIMGFNEVYGTIYNNLEDIFKPAYVGEIRKYYQGISTLSTLNVNLGQLLKTNTGASVGGRMIIDSVANAIRNNPNHPANLILRENDLFRWAPKAPTRIFYCMADDQVPFMNSVIARDSMTARGATNLIATDVNPTANHGGCIVPALTQTIFFFFSFQKITSGIESVVRTNNLKVFPNPVSDLIHVNGLEGKGETIYVFDIEGKTMMSSRNNKLQSAEIDFSFYLPGIYYIAVQSTDGFIQSQRVVKMK